MHSTHLVPMDDISPSTPRLPQTWTLTAQQMRELDVLAPCGKTTILNLIFKAINRGDMDTAMSFINNNH